MAGQQENYAAFNSRALVEMVGDVTDEALKATKIKQFLSVLAGRYFNWAGRKSLFTLHLGIKCCAIEMAAAATPRFDGDRFGVLFRSSPRQSDVLLVNGPITKKFADKVVRLWEQMPEPKYCIAMGECAIWGGLPAMRNTIPLSECLEESYLNGISSMPDECVVPYDEDLPKILDKVYACSEIVDIDHYIPGCPPDANHIWKAVMNLLWGEQFSVLYSEFKYD